MIVLTRQVDKVLLSVFMEIPYKTWKMAVCLLHSHLHSNGKDHELGKFWPSSYECKDPNLEKENGGPLMTHEYVACKRCALHHPELVAKM